VNTTRTMCTRFVLRALATSLFAKRSEGTC
jgi:hypothetical protein